MSYCGIINKELLVATCPLTTGSCMWKHRESGICVYTAAELSVDEFCQRVGLAIPAPSEISQLEGAIISAMRA